MSDDALVLFMPSGRRGRFALGTPLLDAARALGIYVESVCGGRGLCARCQVDVVEGSFAKHGIESKANHLAPEQEIERDFRARLHLAPLRRLSCRATVLGDIVIDVPAEFAVNRQVVRKRAETRAIKPEPATKAVTVAVPEPDMAAPLGDADRLAEAVAAALGVTKIAVDPALLASLPAVLRQGGWTVTAAVFADDCAPTIIAVWPFPDARLFGLAVDIGSTTIAAHLVDLATGRAVASAGTANPQIRFGEDLMSRISYLQMNPAQAGTLTRAAREAVATLAFRLAGQAGIASTDIAEAVVVGNPVMHHLFLGLDPSPLGEAPFALAVSGAIRMAARDAGLHLAPGARLYVPPCIAGHVGADAVAVALADGPQHHDETTLVVDVGTNAEILLGNRSRVLAASSPTGPAFEGAQISAGQRAAPGAIERVRIDPATLEPRVRVLGAEPWSDEPGFAEATDTTGVTGICGSGIIEAVAELFLAGAIASDGRFSEEAASRSTRFERRGKSLAYLLHHGTVPIAVTQNDIRAVQLAKAALYAGARLLMDQLGVDHVDRIKLAGAFGSYIDPRYAMVLGLIPDCPESAVSAIGNAAGTGARMMLVSLRHRAEAEALVRRVEKIETALEPRFQEHFVAAMALPHATAAYPHLSAVVQLPRRAIDRPAGTSHVRRRGRVVAGGETA